MQQLLILWQVLEVLAAQCVGSNAIAVRSNQNVICERLIRSKLDSLLQTKLIDHCVRLLVFDCVVLLHSFRTSPTTCFFHI